MSLSEMKHKLSSQLGFTVKSTGLRSPCILNFTSVYTGTQLFVLTAIAGVYSAVANASTQCSLRLCLNVHLKPSFQREISALFLFSRKEHDRSPSQAMSKQEKVYITIFIHSSKSILIALQLLFYTVKVKEL